MLIFCLIKKVAKTIIPVALIIGATAAGIIAYPYPLFAHHISNDGLELWSDEPFSPEKGHMVLQDVKKRLNKTPLYDSNGTHRVFIVNTPWRRYLTFHQKYNVGGVNFYPLTRNIFIRQSLIKTNQVIGPGGETVPQPRTLSYFIAHEIAHSLTGEKTGPIAFFTLPKWVREGVADYIALPDAKDTSAMLDALKNGDKAMDPKRSGLYHRYRLLVTLALEYEDWSIGKLLASNLSIKDAEEKLFPAPYDKTIAQ